MCEANQAMSMTREYFDVLYSGLNTYILSEKHNLLHFFLSRSVSFGYKIQNTKIIFEKDLHLYDLTSYVYCVMSRTNTITMIPKSKRWKEILEEENKILIDLGKSYPDDPYTDNL